MKNTLATLAIKRPIFHSECDFQHALAWQLHQQLPTANIRLEQRQIIASNSAYIDLTFTNAAENVAIELKYKTTNFSATVGNEAFELLDQSARDLGSRFFWEDVQRLELLRAANPNITRALAIFLTNDSGYWAKPRRIDTNAEAFRLTEGRTVASTLAWGPKTGNTKKGHEDPIQLKGSFLLRWQHYSIVNSPTKPTTFRYLLLEI